MHTTTAEKTKRRSHRGVRRLLALLVFATSITGTAMAVDTDKADAQTVTFGVPRTTSHSARCTINPGASGGIRVSSSFTGNPGEKVIYRYRFWKMNSRGTWDRMYGGEPWRSIHLSNSGTTFTNHSFTVPGGGFPFKIWFVQVESYRVIGGNLTHHRVANANHDTAAYGRLWDVGCLT